MEHDKYLFLRNNFNRSSIFNWAKYLFFTVVIFLVGCSTDHKKDGQPLMSYLELFHLNDQNLSETDKSVLREANEDFQSVRSGQEPIHAKLPKGALHYADGGSADYKGNGYSITVKKSICELGKVFGFLYGPIIHFDGLMKGNTSEVSHLEFYSTEEFDKMIHRSSSEK